MILPQTEVAVVVTLLSRGVWGAGDLLLAAGSNSGEVGIFAAREDPSTLKSGCSFSPCRVLMRAGHTDVMPFSLLAWLADCDTLLAAISTPKPCCMQYRSGCVSTCCWRVVCADY